MKKQKAKKRARKDFENSAIRESRKEILARVREIAEPLCVTEGMELVHLEYQTEPGGTVLRFYIDKPGGVTLDNCVGISRQLGDLLDIDLDINMSYRLEVSSPGINRPLGREQDFRRFSGKTAKIKVDQPVEGQRNFKGILMGIDKGIVELMVDNKKFAIPYETIIKARLVDYNGDNRCL